MFFRRVMLVVSLQMTKPFFSALEDEKVHQRLLALMFDLLVESRSPLVANTVSSIFKVVSGNRQAACAVIWLSLVKDRVLWINFRTEINLCMRP